MDETRQQRITMARRKKAQEIISATTATLGLSALATKGGAVGIKQAIARSPRAAKVAYLPRVAERLDKATIPVLTTSAGIGGLGGFNFASIQREEARREREKYGRTTMAKALTDRERQQRRRYVAGFGALGATATGAQMALTPGFSPKRMASPGKPNTWRTVAVGNAAYRVPNFDGVPPGAGHAMSEYFRQKASVKTRLNTDDEDVKSRYEKIRTSAERETTKGAREAFKAKAKSFEGKYGTTGGPKMRHRIGAKIVGGPKRATGLIYGGAIAAGGAAGAGLGALSARGHRHQDKVLRQKVKAIAESKETLEKSAFGVVSKVYDPERERHKRARAYQAATGAGAVATGVAGGGLLATKAAMPAKRRVDAAARAATKAGAKGKALKLRRVSRALDKVASVPHAGKAGAALVGTSIALGVAHDRIKAHRKGAGRSYSDWWDG